jgi:hypothetical protein
MEGGSSEPIERRHDLGAAHMGLLVVDARVETLRATSVQHDSTWLTCRKLGRQFGQLEIWAVGLSCDRASMHGTGRTMCHKYGRLLDQSGHKDSGRMVGKATGHFMTSHLASSPLSKLHSHRRECKRRTTRTREPIEHTVASMGD